MGNENTLHLGATAGENLYVHPQTEEGVCLSVVSEMGFLPLGIQLSKEDVDFITKDEKTVVLDGLEGVQGTVTPETVILNKATCVMTFLHNQGETTILANRDAWRQMMERFTAFVSGESSKAETPILAASGAER